MNAGQALSKRGVDAPHGFYNEAKIISAGINP